MYGIPCNCNFLNSVQVSNVSNGWRPAFLSSLTILFLYLYFKGIWTLTCMVFHIMGRIFSSSQVTCPLKILMILIFLIGFDLFRILDLFSISVFDIFFCRIFATTSSNMNKVRMIKLSANSFVVRDSTVYHTKCLWTNRCGEVCMYLQLVC